MSEVNKNPQVVKYATLSSPTLKIWIDGKQYTAVDGVLTLSPHAANYLDAMANDPEHAHIAAHVRRMVSLDEAAKIVERHRALNRPAAARGALSSSGPIHPLDPAKPAIEGGKPGGEAETFTARHPAHMIAPESGDAERVQEANRLDLERATLGPAAPGAVENQDFGAAPTGRMNKLLKS